MPWGAGARSPTWMARVGRWNCGMDMGRRGVGASLRQQLTAGAFAGLADPALSRASEIAANDVEPIIRYTPAMFAALKDSIERGKAELGRLRPLSTAALAQLQKHYDVELTYSSNAIEGNTLTLRETAEVIEHGLTVGGKSLRDHLEATDHYQALLWMRGLAAM